MKHYAYESDLEAECTAAVIDRGGEHRKLDLGPGAKGQLDHAYWLPSGRHLIVEFKLPGKKPSPKQAIRIANLRRLNQPVYVIETYESFMELLAWTPRA